MADVVELEVKTIADAERALELEWSKDRSLIIAIMIFDPEQSEARLATFADYLEQMLSDTRVLEHVENQFLSRELPSSLDIGRAGWIGSGRPAVAALLAKVSERQEIVERVRRAFEHINPELFGGAPEKNMFREQAIMRGAYRMMVDGASDGAIGGAAMFALHVSLAGLAGNREILSAWTAGFGRAAFAYDDDLSEDADEVEYGDGPNAGGSGGYQAFRSAIEQQNAILARVAEGDFSAARRFTADLIQSQRVRGDPVHVAKSLTRLSQNAKEMDAAELELEWSFEAVQFAPNDGRAHCQYADALLQFGRLEEAEAEFDLAAANGEYGYALTGKARLLRHQGAFKEALAASTEAKSALEGTDQEVYAWRGAAQSYRDMGDLNAAIEEYTCALQKFPFDQVLKCAYASTLLELGEFNLAWSTYEDALTLDVDKTAPLNGLAGICRQLGNLDKARARYSYISENWPRDIYGHIGLIDTLRLMGEHSAASALARRTADRFPGSPLAAARLAEVTSEAGRDIEARRLYKAAIIKFPTDARLYLGAATAFRREGRYDRALTAYEVALRRFPHSDRAEAGRAHMLRRLGRLAEAESIYRTLISRNPHDLRLSNSLASILIVTDREEEAERLLENDNPRTQDEWRSFALFAVLVDRKGDPSHALERLRWGIANCPFMRENRLLKAALAAQLIRQGRARKAPLITNTPERDIGNIIDFQAAAAARRSSALVLYKSLKTQIPPHLAEIRDEIARCYKIIPGSRQRSNSWIGSNISQGLVLAIAA